MCGIFQTFPKPWTVEALLQMLVRILRIAEFHHKNDILDAILHLFVSEGFSNADAVYKVRKTIIFTTLKPSKCLLLL